MKGLDAGAVARAPPIDRIAVTPVVGRARLSGGRHYPAEGVQFQAIAYAKGAAAAEKQAAVVPAALKSGEGDVALGRVPAKFTLVEEKTRDGDDDLRYVGAIAPNGSYVPKGDYRRMTCSSFSTEGAGLVKVVATFERGGRPFEPKPLAVPSPTTSRGSVTADSAWADHRLLSGRTAAVRSSSARTGEPVLRRGG